MTRINRGDCHDDIVLGAVKTSTGILQLGIGIELPAAHAQGGWVLPGQHQPGERLAKPLVEIHSGLQTPANAYAAVPCLGYWYWIRSG